MRVETLIDQLEAVRLELQNLMQQKVDDADSFTWIQNVQDTTIRVSEMCQLLLRETPEMEG
jgi:hypothetical protein